MRFLEREKEADEKRTVVVAELAEVAGTGRGTPPLETDPLLEIEIEAPPNNRQQA